ncbi:amidase [Yunchengibacter salinarum]|uniref:amidase n=1 Tax=Yunchengibacter salinarum TaxID=3133399 RepID=UPI0035B5B2D4
MSQDEIANMTAIELLRHYHDGTLSPVEAAEAALTRIDAHDETVNAFCHVDPDTTLAFARASEERYRRHNPCGLLDGVPVGVKDVFLTREWPTRKGSRTVDPAVAPDEDAPVVSALKRNGYVPVGKTTTPEFGWKGVTDNPIDGITRNAWNPDRTAGGSSGGSASSVALGMGPLALGTDAGGSIRIPAGFSGIVGHKPTQGRVPFWPPSPFGNLAHPGPMSWTVEDAALMMDVLTESDPRDATLPPPEGSYLEALTGRVDDLRIAYSPTLGYVDVDPEIRASLDRAVETLIDLGAQVDRVDPGFEDPRTSFDRLFYGGAANAMRDLGPDKRALMDPNLVKVCEWAEGLSGLDYMAALNEQRILTEQMGRFHNRYDLLLTPSLPIPAFTAGLEVPEGADDPRWPGWTRFTYPFNMTGQPACSVPCGFTGDGLPIGLQLVGGRHMDALVLRAAHAYQLAAPLTHIRPALLAD